MINKIHQGDVLEVLKSWPDAFVDCIITSVPYWMLRDYGVDGQIGLEPTPELYISKLVEVFREGRRVLKKEGTLWLNCGDTYAANRSYQVSDNKHTDVGNSMGMKTKLLGLKPKDLCGIPWMLAFALRQPYYTGKIKNEKDRIWLASMIDGEGCLFIHKRKIGQSNGQGYQRKNDTYSSGLEVANTHESIIQRCMEITGQGSICRVERETKYKNRNIPLYRWNMRSNQCRDIIREVYPYLVGKQHEARILIGCPSSGVDAEKSHASLIALHNGKEACIDFPPPESLYQPGFYLRQDIIWKKPNPMPESVTDRCTKAHEYLFLLSKAGKYYYDSESIKEKKDEECRRAHTFRNDCYIGNKKFDNNFIEEKKDTAIDGPKAFGRNRRSVWTIATHSFPDAHFATFPPNLVEPCILAGCPKDGLVLDPFMGSGTTALVAYEHGRNFIGIELNPAYIEMANKRLNKAQQQMRMF